MGKGNSATRLAKRRSRREKLHKLRAKFRVAQSEVEKKKILEKAAKIAPWLTKKEFLAP